MINSSTVKAQTLAIIPARGGSKGIPRKNDIDIDADWQRAEVLAQLIQTPPDADRGSVT